MSKKTIINRIRYILGFAGIIGPVLFLSITVSLDVLQSSPDQVIKTVSDLVHGSYGWLQNLAFASLAFCFLLFITKLYVFTKRKLSSLAGILMLSITGIGFILITIFPSQVSGLGQTLQGLLHDSIAGLIATSFMLGCIAFTHHFRKDPHWKNYWIYTLITVILCFSFAMLWALLPREWQIEGVGERLLLISAFAWVMVISLKLMKMHRQSQETVAVPVYIERDLD